LWAIGAVGALGALGALVALGALGPVVAVGAVGTVGAVGVGEARGWGLWTRKELASKYCHRFIVNVSPFSPLRVFF
jgi:hypothetical protein